MVRRAITHERGWPLQNIKGEFRGLEMKEEEKGIWPGPPGISKDW